MKNFLVTIGGFSLAANAGDKQVKDKLKLPRIKHLTPQQCADAKFRISAWTSYLQRTQGPTAPGDGAERARRLREALQLYITELQIRRSKKVKLQVPRCFQILSSLFGHHCRVEVRVAPPRRESKYLPPLLKRVVQSFRIVRVLERKLCVEPIS